MLLAAELASAEVQARWQGVLSMLKAPAFILSTTDKPEPQRNTISLFCSPLRLPQPMLVGSPLCNSSITIASF